MGSIPDNTVREILTDMRGHKASIRDVPLLSCGVDASCSSGYHILDIPSTLAGERSSDPALQKQVVATQKALLEAISCRYDFTWTRTLHAEQAIYSHWVQAITMPELLPGALQRQAAHLLDAQPDNPEYRAFIYRVNENLDSLQAAPGDNVRTIDFSKKGRNL